MVITYTISPRPNFDRTYEAMKALYEYVDFLRSVTHDDQRKVKGTGEYSLGELLGRTYAAIKTGNLRFMTRSYGLRSKLEEIINRYGDILQEIVENYDYAAEKLMDLAAEKGYNITYDDDTWKRMYKSSKLRAYDKSNPKFKDHISIPVNESGADGLITTLIGSYLISRGEIFKIANSNFIVGLLNESYQSGKQMTVYTTSIEDARKVAQTIYDMYKTLDWASEYWGEDFRSKFGLLQNDLFYKGDRRIGGRFEHDDDSINDVWRKNREIQLKLARKHGLRDFQ